MQTLQDILSSDGALSELIPDYTYRPQQQALASAIDMAIKEQHSLVCEAGTGTGKTFAYLVPALLSGKKVIISTGTKHLQDQLYLRDLPLIHKTVKSPLNVSLLKGRANYLCLHQLNLSETPDRFFQKESLSLLQDIKEWAEYTTHGDLSELTHIPEDAAVRSQVTSTTENCLNQECDFFDKCHLIKARRHANDADVVVVNHHLLFSDLALRDQGYGELLPTADIIIFDEAHQLPDIASMFFGQTVSSRQIMDLSRDSKAAYYEEAADLPEFLILLDALEKSSRDYRLSLGKFDNRAAWKELRSNTTTANAFDLLIDRLHDLHTALDSFANRGKSLENCYKRTGLMLNMLDEFNESRGNNYIQWMETRGNGFLFHQTPLSTAETFQSHMSEYDCLSIFTSATLSVSGDFSHFSTQLGLEEVQTLSFESPFDFKQQALLYLPENMPDPREQQYTQTVIERAVPVLKLTQGHAFILFTSHRALKIAAGLLKDEIDYPILIQGDAPRTELLEKFRRTEHAVLLGTSSFWEGVDVKGQQLSCVIIDKLPFSSPGDPVLKARMQMLEEQGKRPFIDYQVPEAVLTLKQGIGRLIRDANDYGLLMLCDPRLMTKAYGRMFLKSLPSMGRTSVLSEIEVFFEQFEN